MYSKTQQRELWDIFKNMIHTVFNYSQSVWANHLIKNSASHFTTKLQFRFDQFCRFKMSSTDEGHCSLSPFLFEFFFQSSKEFLKSQTSLRTLSMNICSHSWRKEDLHESTGNLQLLDPFYNNWHSSVEDKKNLESNGEYFQKLRNAVISKVMQTSISALQDFQAKNLVAEALSDSTDIFRSEHVCNLIFCEKYFSHHQQRCESLLSIRALKTQVIGQILSPKILSGIADFENALDRTIQRSFYLLISLREQKSKFEGSSISNAPRLLTERSQLISSIFTSSKNYRLHSLPLSVRY
jgi:hypothetical protein